MVRCRTIDKMTISVLLFCQSYAFRRKKEMKKTKTKQTNTQKKRAERETDSFLLLKKFERTNAIFDDNINDGGNSWIRHGRQRGRHLKI